MLLKFCGAAKEVTGSNYLLEVAGKRVLVDCGMHQGDHEEANYEPFPYAANLIDAVLLTHAHIDHSGRIPKLVREGFRGKIYATLPTIELTEILWDDSVRLMREDAEWQTSKNERRGLPAVEPLYGQEDADAAKKLFEPVNYDQRLDIFDGISVRFRDAGHILGSSIIEMLLTEANKVVRIVFSGDLGPMQTVMERAPAEITDADYVVIESTYGNREHQATASIPEQLESIIHRVKEEGGNLVIPSFAVERTQDLLYFLALLSAEDRIPHLPIYVDSPMASRVNTVFMHHPYLFDADTMKLARTLRLSNVNIVRSMAESKMVNHIKGTAIIIAGSGMCTGGRIKHHLVHNISRPECTILFVGYQASQTLGRLILDGEPEVRILGEICPVKAHIERIDGFSAHADRNELLRWLGTLETTPKHVFVTHGEPDAAASLRDLIAEQKGFEASVPEYLQTVELG
jgi:metallo-beta-lactamase family protein